MSLFDKQGVEIDSIETNEPDMESVFVKATHEGER